MTIISNNATGCASLQQVAAACGVLAVEENRLSERCMVYPNPCEGIADFRFQISDFGKISLRISDIQGREVAHLLDENLPAGEYNITWNAGKLSPGVYLYRLTHNGLSSTGKLILLR